ncbi:MAG: outer membrane beta-barrel protein [Burkholderiales bacterium]
MKPSILAASLVGGIVVSVPSLAQTSPGDDTGWRMPYERGFWGHAGLSLGRSELDITCPAGAACDDTEQAFRAFAGGRFNNAIGAEIAYIKFGDFTRGGGETDAEGADLALIAGIPFAKNWSIFGKLGGIYSQVDVTGTAPGLATGGENGWGPRLGVGLQMGLTENWALRADYDRYRIKVPGDQRENVDTLLIGAQYTFR